MPPNVQLQAGSTDSASVKALQTWLVANNYMTQADMNTGAGTYGPKTTAAVTALQNHLVSTGQMTPAQMNTGPGTYGPQTYASATKPASSNQSTSQPASGSPTGPNTSGTATKTSGAQTSQAPLFNSYGVNVYPNATASYGGGRVTWTNPDGTYVWLSADTNQFPTNATYFQQYAPSVYPQVQKDYPSTTTKGPSTPTNPTGTTPTGSTTPLAANSGTQTTKGQLPSSILSSIKSVLTQGNPLNNSVEVKALQDSLVAAGYMTAAQQTAGGSGIYGPQTAAAVSAWQTDNNLPATGIYDVASHNYLTDLNKSSIDGSNPSTGKTLPTDTNNAINSANAAGIFNELTKRLQPGTPEYQAAIDAVDTSMYTILQQQATAGTEQEQQVATYNWGKLRDYINTNLGVTLSNDSMQAWTQVQGMKTQYGALNLENSGLQQESMDDYLRNVRSNGSSQRYIAQTKEDEAKQAYYTQYATPAEIQKLAQTDAANAKAWGLTPADGLTMAQRTAQMQSQFPNMSTSAIAQSLATTYDENGNYRSSLYNSYMNGRTAGIQTGSADPLQQKKDQYGNTIGYGNLTPQDSGILDIQATKAQDQQVNALSGSAGKALAAMAAQRDANPSSIINGPSDSTSNQLLKSSATPHPAAGLPAPASTPASLGNPVPSNTNAPSNTYQFKSFGGNVQRYNNGTLESTGTAASMAPYGYTGS